MSPTLRDVARVAGVSFKTVSNVINDYPHVSESTRARVLAAIEELDYRPNRTAGGDRRRELEVLHGSRRQLTDGLLFSPLALGSEDAQLLDVPYPLVRSGSASSTAPSTT